MKKNDLTSPNLATYVKKMLRIMKLTTIFMFLGILNTFAGVYSQDAPISVNILDGTLTDLFNAIEKKTDYKIFYKTSLINDANHINVAVNQKPVAELLTMALEGKNLSFDVVDKVIVITPMENKQQQKVSGTITDAVTGELLPGVSISVEGTSAGVISDLNGKYEIEVPSSPNAALTFSFVGYITEKIVVSGQTTIMVTLTPDIKKLEEIVVVGYGLQKKVDLTGSVSSISAQDLESRPITQASQALAGLASGVSVSQNSGRPGDDGGTIRIRGTGTFSDAGNDPLVLVDGLASSINAVDPDNIQSISVLKDAASASIYGTRAANGVILIETKHGQKGKHQVGYNSYVGWQKVTALPEFLDSWEYATLKNEANENEGLAKTYTDEEIAKYKSGSDPDNYPNVPHLKNLVTSGSGFQTNHNLNFMGGEGKNSYLFSLGYLHQDGIVTKDHYDRYNFLLNFDSKIKENLKLKVNLSGNSSVRKEPRDYDGDMNHMIGYAVREAPIFAGKKSDGTYGYQDNYSPEGWLASESFNKYKDKRLLGGVELSWELFKGFTLSGKAGYNYNCYTNDYYAAKFEFDSTKTVEPSNLTVKSGDNSLVTLQSLVQYTKKIDKHSFTLLAGFSQESSREDWTSGYRKTFSNDLLYELNAGSETGMSSSGSGSEWALRSYFGRLNYSFKERYLFEANARYDGTSRFPEKGRWGLFPSLSAGWRISEESFIKDNLRWIDNLKLRASWGKLGNQNVGNYPYQNVVKLGNNYSFGGTLASGAAVTSLSNSDITWESTQVTDIGLDVNILKNKLGLVFDYFDKTTSDILYSISVSGVLGLTPSEVNAGEVKNTGFEVLLNYQETIGKVRVGVIPNFSYIRNKVTKLANVEKDIDKGLFIGKPISSIYGYEADGLFVNDADIASYATQPSTAKPGMIRYKDISGPNGVPDGSVDATYDRKVIGNTIPKYSYGATITADYKGFDFSLLLEGLGGYEKQMGSYMAFAFYNSGQIQRWQADNRWTTENPDRNAKYPALTSLNQGSENTQTSTFWIKNASFLRVKNVQLGYSFSNSALQKIKIDKFRVYISGQNLFSFNHFYKGWDPEMYQATGDSPSFYPITSVYTIGINVKF
jgi:TonB-dependent starch-binding outer membrane protein SusC